MERLNRIAGMIWAVRIAAWLMIGVASFVVCYAAGTEGEPRHPEAW